MKSLKEYLLEQNQEENIENKSNEEIQKENKNEETE